MATTRRLHIIIYALLLSVEIQAQQYEPDAPSVMARADRMSGSMAELELKSDSAYMMNSDSLTSCMMRPLAVWILSLPLLWRSLVGPLFLLSRYLLRLINIISLIWHH